LKEKMPENMDLADVIQQIDSAAEKAGLDFFSFTPELPINVGNFYVTTIETKFYGRYFHLVEFFNHIERLPRSVKPITLSIKGGDDNLPYLDITIKFRVFFTTDKEVEKLVKSPTATGGGTAPPTPQAGK
jgi:Tfp pilus assembly protein PilO